MFRWVAFTLKSHRCCCLNLYGIKPEWWQVGQLTSAVRDHIIIIIIIIVVVVVVNATIDVAYIHDAKNRKVNRRRKCMTLLCNFMFYVIFSRSYTAARSIIGFWHDTVVCLHVTKCTVAKRYILHSVWTSKYEVPPGARISQLSTWTYIDPIPQTHHLLNHRRWCHLANKLYRHCGSLSWFGVIKSIIMIITRVPENIQ